MRLLVFQHTPGETAAAFETHAKAAGDAVHTVHLYLDQPIPDLAQFDALLVLGGPMDVWQHDLYPWLNTEIAAIRAWIALQKPYLGICLGHQLLIQAMGGSCRVMATPEIAVSDVVINDSANDPLLSGLPHTFAALHWHGVEADILPPGATILASSADCTVQAIHVPPCAWGLQFHPEIEPGTATGWMHDVGNRQAAIDWLSSEAAALELVADTEAHTTGFVERSQSIYTAFRTL